jgi:hypothetical protein
MFLFRREFVLLAAFFQLKSICQEIKRSSNLPVNTMPRVIIGRIAQISIDGEWLFHA